VERSLGPHPVSVRNRQLGVSVDFTLPAVCLSVCQPRKDC
jgi:hypothetical protein